MPLFSIITINLNNASGLRKTIDSVLTQTYPDYEYIIIDGGSSDESIEIINHYKSSLSYAVSEKDTGIYNAMNKGILKAKGDYLLFLNSGDLLYDGNVFQNVANEKPKEDILFGNVIFSKNNDRRIEVQPKNIGIIHMIRGTLFHPGSFIKNSFIKSLGGYDENFKIASDYDLFVKAIIKEKATYRHIDYIISVFDESGISNQNKILDSEERTRIHERYFTKEQLKDAAVYSKLISSLPYRLLNFIENKTGIRSLTKRFFKINYY